MTIEIKVPILPESVSDALMLDWSRKPGDQVTRDEILVEVETDKVVLEVPAPADGILSEIIEQSGATVLAEQVIGRIEAGAPATADDSKPATADSPAQDDKQQQNSGDDRKLGPAARRLIDEHGLDPARIEGSGRDQRITKEDVLNYMAAADSATPAAAPEQPDSAAAPGHTTAPAAAPAPAAALAEADGNLRRQTRVPMTRLRQTIARRLLQAQQNAALLTTFNEVNMQPVMALRSKYKEAFEKKHGARLGFMSFFVKASVAALQRFPLVNAHIDGTDIIQNDYCDIGIAVSSPRGLVVPVLRNCELMSYAQVEQQIQEFGARAQQGKIGVDELTGGTFTVTNGGVFGSLLSTPIVNPPQSAILGMHKIQQRPVAENGAVVIRPIMYLALSYDHRIIDGKEAVQFLVTIKDSLEDPARLLLDC